MSKIKHKDKTYLARAQEARSKVVASTVQPVSVVKETEQKKEEVMACQKPGLKMKKPGQGRKPKDKK